MCKNQLIKTVLYSLQFSSFCKKLSKIYNIFQLSFHFKGGLFLILHFMYILLLCFIFYLRLQLLLNFELYFFDFLFLISINIFKFIFEFMLLLMMTSTLAYNLEMEPFVILVFKQLKYTLLFWQSVSSINFLTCYDPFATTKNISHHIQLF